MAFDRLRAPQLESVVIFISLQEDSLYMLTTPVLFPLTLPLA